MINVSYATDLINEKHGVRVYATRTEASLQITISVETVDFTC